MADAPAFVPVATAVPSRWRIVRRDPSAKLLAIVFVLGVVLVASYLVDTFRAPGAPDLAAPRSLLGTPWLLAGCGLVVGLPLRLWRIRRLFRHGVEVAGWIATPHRGFRSTTIAYRYAYGGATYIDHHPIAVATPLARDARVAVVVDPACPARSILKHAFILEPVDPVPRARLHRG